MKKYKKFLLNFYNQNKNNAIGKTLRYIKYSILARKKSNFEGTKGDLKYVKAGEGIFKNTKRIAIELSNICNYATIHPRCPLHIMKDKKILSENIVYHVLETCQKYNYQGYIAYDVYNEPTIDPRLMMFMKKTKKMLPNVKLILQTNGFYFDQTLAEEFERHGVDLVRISAYTPQEYERLSKIKLNIPVKVTNIVLDNRMEIYSLPENDCKRPCPAPLNELLITSEGKISLCCLDWKRKNLFGDLNKQSLEEILSGKKIKEAYERLSKGDRFLDICRRCEGNR